MDKKKIHRLTVKPVQDFFLVAISSHENDYRLSWSINRTLGFELKRTDNLKAFNEQLDEDQEFSVFSFHDEELYLKFDLISNRCSNGFLLHEYRNVDFFLQVGGEISEKKVQEIADKLRTIDIITTAFTLRNLPQKSLRKFHS